MLEEFREFALRGNALDMAVGIIIGAAFGTIVRSLVDDVLMPPLGLVLGGVDFTNLFVVLSEGAPAGPYASLAAAQDAGAVTINYGVFFNAVVSFLLVSVVLFVVVRSYNRLERKREAEEKAPAAPAEASGEEKLLREIRDLLEARA